MTETELERNQQGNQDVTHLQKEIRQKLYELQAETSKVEKEFLRELNILEKQGAIKGIIKEELVPFLKEAVHCHPTRDPHVWEIDIPVFLPYNIGWWDRREGGYNIFKIDQYTRWFGEEIPSFIAKQITLPPKWDIALDDETLTFNPELQGEVEDRFSKHLSLIDKGKATVKIGHRFTLLAEILAAGQLPFKPRPISPTDLQESDFTQIYDELKERYFPLNIFEGKYAYQGKAWKTFEKFGCISIIWAMSMGKTVIGTYIFSRVKGRKALVVPNNTLRDHWQQFFKWNCPRLLNEVEIYTYQGMSRKSWKDLGTKEFTVIGFEECLTGDTLIQLADGSIKRIDGVRNGDVVVGGKVRNYFYKRTQRQQLLEIRTSFSKLRCTTTHPCLILKKEFDAHSNQYHAVSLQNIWVVPACLVKRGDYMLSPESLPLSAKPNEFSPALARLYALILCDGHIEGRNNTVKISMRKNGEKDWIENVFKAGIRALRISRKPWGFVNGRGDYTVGLCSGKLKSWLLDMGVPTGNKSNIIDINDLMFNAPKKTIKAFIDVCFSCEGWIGTLDNGSKQVYFSCSSEIFSQKLQLLLKKFGIHSYLVIQKRKNRKHRKQYRVVVGGRDYNKFCRTITLTHPHKRRRLSPDNRTRNENDMIEVDGKSYRLVKVHSIADMKKSCRVYDFEVPSSNTFVANGILTHNCHFLPAPMFSRLATLKTKYRFGLSATPYREDGQTENILALAGPPEGMDWRPIMKILGKTYHEVNVHVVRDLDSKFVLMKQLYNPQQRTIIFVNLIDIGNKASEMLNLPMISGQTEDRLEIIKKSLSFVATRVVELGVSIKDLDHIIELDFLYGSRREALQRTGRLMHSLARSRVHDIIFTGEEYDKYGKRLYGLYEKGFRYRLVPHLRGVTSPAVTRRTPSKTQRRVPRKREEPAGVAPPVQLSSAVTQRLPEISRTLERLTPVERAVANVILGNPQNTYTAKQLVLATGYTPKTIMNQAHLGKLVQLGLIKREKHNYRSAL